MFGGSLFLHDHHPYTRPSWLLSYTRKCLWVLGAIGNNMEWVGAEGSYSLAVLPLTQPVAYIGRTQRTDGPVSLKVGQLLLTSLPAPLVGYYSSSPRTPWILPYLLQLMLLWDCLGLYTIIELDAGTKFFFIPKRTLYICSIVFIGFFFCIFGLCSVIIFRAVCFEGSLLVKLA